MARTRRRRWPAVVLVVGLLLGALGGLYLANSLGRHDRCKSTDGQIDQSIDGTYRHGCDVARVQVVLGYGCLGGLAVAVVCAVVGYSTDPR